METRVLSAEKQADAMKEKGNLCFQKGRLNAAIEAYTEAITLTPGVPTYWTNRALCHRRKNDWERMEADCRKALELDNNSVKAHYMLGLALLQHQQYEDAVKQLEKALELGRGGKPSTYMVEEIWQEVTNARFSEWEHISRSRVPKRKELRAFCEEALKEDFSRRLVNAKEKCNLIVDLDSPSSGPSSIGKSHEALDDRDSSDSLALDLSKLQEDYQEKRRLLSEVFEVASEPDTPFEIPEYLCCKITMDIFRDPVIAPSGVTYERAAILQHLQKLGKFDPFTRASLEPEELVPNLAIKEAVQAFLSKHGWAYKMCQVYY